MKKKQYKVAVFAISSCGEREVVEVIVTCKWDDYDNGQHYEAAAAAVEDEGYEAAVFEIDENDVGFQNLTGLDWENSIKTEI